jgi:RNA polymerase sporulation-specific sigma factor
MLEILSTVFGNLFFLILNVDNTSLFPKSLKPDEEKECFFKMSQGNTDARNKLIVCNLRLVAFIVKKYHSNIKDQDDLISIGTIGLIKAVSSFNYDKGIKFATYASKCIENEILMQFRADKKNSKNIFIETPIETDKDGNSLTFLDIIPDPENIIEQIDLLLGTEKLYSMIRSCLDEREFEIIVNRYGLFGHLAQTQKDVSARLNISRSYVSRLEKAALKKLRRELDS